MAAVDIIFHISVFESISPFSWPSDQNSSFLMFPLFLSKLWQRSNAFIHQNTSGILYFPFINPDRLKCRLFFFFAFVSWLGMRALPSVARGLPGWLESLRGKRAECFWGLEPECETLGDAARLSSPKYTLWRICSLHKGALKSEFCPCWWKCFTEMQSGRLQVLLHRAWGNGHNTADAKAQAKQRPEFNSFFCTVVQSIF